jgi:hypothetical protein
MAPLSQSIEMSLADLSIIALARAASEPIPVEGPQAGAVSYALYAMPHHIRQRLALGDFGAFQNEYLQRHPVFDAEFGLAAGTVQRFYRGYRIRRYLELARSPQQSPWWHHRPDSWTTSLFDIAPPKAFIQGALAYTNDVDQCRDDLLDTQQAWASFLLNYATDQKRAAFARCADQLVVVPLDRVRAIEQLLDNLARSTIAGILAAAQFQAAQAVRQEQRELIGSAAGIAGVLPMLYISVPRALPFMWSSTVGFFKGCAAFGGASLLLNMPLLWPAAILPMAFGCASWGLAALRAIAGWGTAVVPPVVAHAVAGATAEAVVGGAQACWPSPESQAYQIAKQQLELQLAQLRGMYAQATQR